VTLLLHQHRVADALAHFRLHMQQHRRPALPLPAAAAAAHWGWVSRQYCVMGELMRQRGAEAAQIQDVRRAALRTSCPRPGNLAVLDPESIEFAPCAVLQLGAPTRHTDLGRSLERMRSAHVPKSQSNVRPGAQAARGRWAVRRTAPADC
jgi:Foie gras liver health family 1